MNDPDCSVRLTISRPGFSYGGHAHRAAMRHSGPILCENRHESKVARVFRARRRGKTQTEEGITR